MVTTLSRLSSKEASDARVPDSPHISKTGATTPPAITAPASHG